MTRALGIIGCIINYGQLHYPSQELETGSFTAELNGFAIHYEVRGSGPVLMTVPNSWGLSLEGLRGLFRPLEKHLTMVYFDPRGMGDSEAAREEIAAGIPDARYELFEESGHFAPVEEPEKFVAMVTSFLAP
ncbi:MAG: hypothetical protein BMS9Abin37_1832 [Acidobacteriota bacterium]|nr:MAG: hypothetical protein BMS9Abin37_1832 [Acidobacteriota bacterium]